MSYGVEEVGQVSDAELVSRLERLVRADRLLGTKLLVHLGELEERRLYLGRGYSSMYEYCRKALRMSDGEAYLRIQAAKSARQFPLVLERLEAGAVHLSGIKLLAKHLTADNHVQLLDRVRGWSKRQIEVLAAELEPKDDAPARIRKLPAPAAAKEAPVLAAPEPAAAVQSSTATQVLTAPAAPAFTLQAPRACTSTKPLSPGRFKLEVTLGQEAHDKLEQLQELLRHQNPSGDLASIVERALTELLEREMKRRFAQTKTRRPRTRSGTDAKSERQSKAPARSRYIPREVVRQVFARDNGQCTFVSPEGHRCTARGFLEVHHHKAFARGGATTADNLKLACRAHNFFLAEQDYGRTFMQQKLRAATPQPTRSGTCPHAMQAT